MKNQKAVHHPSPAPLAAHRSPPVQHETNVTRAYRLGKSETLWDFVRLLVEEQYTRKALYQEVMDRMIELTLLDPAEILGPENVQKFQECQGQADACKLVRDFLDTQTLGGDDLDSFLAHHLFAAWPPAYLEYRQRYMAFQEKDPTMPDKVDCLELRDWYEVVDSLAYVIDRDRRAGLPPSHDQNILAIALLRTTGEPTPCAE